MYSPLGLYVDLAFDVLVAVDGVLVALAPDEFEPGTTYGAFRVVLFVVARTAPRCDESSTAPNKSCFSRLVFFSP